MRNFDEAQVLSERHLRRVLKSYFAYYHHSRTHLALAKDVPEARAIQYHGQILAIPQVGGLHHRYDALRKARRPKFENNQASS